MILAQVQSAWHTCDISGSSQKGGLLLDSTFIQVWKSHSVPTQGDVAQDCEWERQLGDTKASWERWALGGSWRQEIYFISVCTKTSGAMPVCSRCSINTCSRYPPSPFSWYLADSPVLPVTWHLFPLYSHPFPLLHKLSCVCVPVALSRSAWLVVITQYISLE